MEEMLTILIANSPSKRIDKTTISESNGQCQSDCIADIKEFVKLVIITFFIAVPIAWYAKNE